MNNKQAYEFLLNAGLLEYGAVIEAKLIREAFGISEIEYPAQKKEIQEQELAELSAVGYIRDRLLNLGRYIKGERDTYRVLLPSENAGQVLAYMDSADRKLKRGIKLNKNTPVEYKISDKDEVRAIMKRESIKDGNRG